MHACAGTDGYIHVVIRAHTEARSIDAKQQNNGAKQQNNGASIKTSSHVLNIGLCMHTHIISVFKFEAV